MINERLDELQTLKRKYGETIADVLDFARRAEQELAQIENLDREIAEQQRKAEEILDGLLALQSS